jgi:GAF domain-containing protein
MALHNTAVPLWRARVEDVLITGELRYRIPKDSAFLAKSRSKERFLKELAGKSSSIPEFLKALVRAAREVCGAGAAGVSVLVYSPQGTPLVRWENVCGALSHCEGATSPLHWSPSGATLDRKAPQLFLYPARCFHHLDRVTPTIVESLVVPIFVDDVPWGTLWVASNDEHQNFDQTDVDAVKGLAEFAAGVLGRAASAAPA